MFVGNGHPAGIAHFIDANGKQLRTSRMESSLYHCHLCEEEMLKIVTIYIQQNLICLVNLKITKNVI